MQAVAFDGCGSLRPRGRGHGGAERQAEREGDEDDEATSVSVAGPRSPTMPYKVGAIDDGADAERVIEPVGARAVVWDFAVSPKSARAEAVAEGPRRGVATTVSRGRRP
jgi:hypothetical protein